MDTKKIVHADVLTNVSLLLKKKKKKLILSNAIMGLYWGGGGGGSSYLDFNVGVGDKIHS